LVLDADTRSFFESLKKKEEVPNLLFAGPPGTGKTSLSKIIINEVLDCQYLYLNASDENGIDTVRQKIIGFAQTKSLDGKIKVVLCDEADSLTNEGQKALRNVIEEYSHNTRFIFTCNYLFKIIPALQSRCQRFDLSPPLEGVVNRLAFILKSEKIEVPAEEKPKLIELARSAFPDLRKAINDVQKFSHSGVLQIKHTQIGGLAKMVVLKILNKESVVDIRKFVIEREQDFAGDYTSLIKEMFEAVFNKADLEETIKGPWLFTLTEALYRDSIVIDKEINWFSAVLRLSGHSNP